MLMKRCLLLFGCLALTSSLIWLGVTNFIVLCPTQEENSHASQTRWETFVQENMRRIESTLKAENNRSRTLARTKVQHTSRKHCLPNRSFQNLPKEFDQRMSIMEPNMTLWRKGFKVEGSSITSRTRSSRHLRVLSSIVGDEDRDYRILILSPVKATDPEANRFYNLINSLDYPHKLITVVVGVDPNNPNAYEAYKNLKERFSSFKKYSVIQLTTISPDLGSSWTEIHMEAVQLERRKALAMARNELLSRSLADEYDFVLWVDSDVLWWPTDTVQHLLSAGQDVTVPSCMWRNEFGNLSLYDRNSWQETDVSRDFLKGLPEDSLMLEGYGNSMRLYLTDLRLDTRLIPLDGVGGCVLLIRADCHRKGLNFPAFLYRNHIETEGLSKMAVDLGFSVCGLPYFLVIHS